MIRKITIPLLDNEKDTLLWFAEREKRDPRQQAALFVRRGLEQAGLLKPALPGGGQ